MGSKIVETAYIDVSESTDLNEMIFSLNKNIETGEYGRKKIILNLGETELNQAQLLGIKALVENVESMIDFIYSSSATTKLSALTSGISIANQKDGSYEKEQCDVITAERDMLLDELITEKKDLHKSLKSEVIPNDMISEMQYIEMESSKSQEDDDDDYEEDTDESQGELQGRLPLEERNSEEGTKEVLLEETIETEEKEAINESALDNRQFILDEKEHKHSGETVYIQQTLRSGQVVTYDGNVVIIGDCHSGSEIVASGDITVWGVLGGIAHAGACGDESAKIRALKIDAIQLRIGKYFARRPDRANIEFVEKTNTFTPEEARVEDGGIFIYSLRNS